VIGEASSIAAAREHRGAVRYRFPDRSYGEDSMAKSKVTLSFPHISRRPIHQDIHRLWRRHAHQAGEIAIAWNDLHASCYELFHSLTETKDQNTKISSSIWNSFQSDSAQRAMLLAVARSALPQNSRILAKIEWLINITNDLAKFRNDPIHTPIVFVIDSSDKLVVSPNFLIGKEGDKKA
jgi:hypothetical protein